MNDQSIRGTLGARWLFCVQPIEGEALSSLLSRQAHFSSVSLGALLKSVGPEGYRRTIDWEVNPPEEALASLADRFGVDRGVLQQGLLTDRLLAISPGSHKANLLEHDWRPRHSTWLLPSAWLGLKDPFEDRESGIPFCQACMMESEATWFPAINRLSFMVGCARHRILLRDSCPRCEHAYSPGTTTPTNGWVGPDSEPLCIRCPNQLGPGNQGERSGLEAMGVSDSTLCLQKAMLEATEGRRIQVPQVGTLTPQQFMAGFRFINTAASFLLDHGIEAHPMVAESFRSLAPMLFRSKGQGSFEFCTLQDRARRMDWMAWVFERPLDRWHLITEIRGLPASIAKASRHPWEGIDEFGVPSKYSSWHRRAHRKLENANFEEDRRFHAVIHSLGLKQGEIRAFMAGMSERQFMHWLARPTQRVPTKLQHRIEHFLRIWDGVCALLGDENASRSWFNTPSLHPKLAGDSPMGFLTRDMDGGDIEFLSTWLGKGSIEPL